MKKMETYIGGWDFWKRVGGDWCWEKNRKQEFGSDEGKLERDRFQRCQLRERLESTRNLKKG